MKLRHLLFGLLAGVAFVACTNDDDPAGASPVNGGDKVATAPKYMTVNFITSDGAATRAEGDVDENAINDAVFLFFKNGAQVAEPFEIAKKGADAVNPQGPYAGQKDSNWDGKTAVVVLDNPKDIPTSLVVLVNTGKTKDYFSNKTVADLQGEGFVADYSATTNGIVMSNAVYNDASGNVVGAPVIAANVCETPEAARDNAVQVNVDRVLAKVSVTAKDGLKPESGSDKIEVEINGWGLVYENSQSFLVKKLGTSYPNLPTSFAWNDATNKRSYWAESATYVRKNGPSHKDAAKNSLGTTLYTQENTASPTAFTEGAETNPTAVVVAATLKYKASADATATAQNLYKFKGGVYTEADLKILLANPFEYYKESTSTTAATTFTKLEADDYALDYEFPTEANKLESYQAKVNLKLAESVKNVYDAAGNEIEDLSTVTDALKAAVETVEYWNGGATYYYVPIKQYINATTPTEFVYGVVRNHSYQLNITSVKGLGTAVPQPGVVIVPITPVDGNYYIAAEIKVLDWKLVAQDVALGAE